MPAFFRELLRDGQIDRALAVARGKVRERGDAWMPALYTRLTAGRLWYTPGFRGERQGGVALDCSRRSPTARSCRSSARACSRRPAGPRTRPRRGWPAPTTTPSAAHEWDDLPRVTEYMSVKESRYNVIQAYQDQLLHDLIDQHRGWLPPAEIPPATRSPRLGKLLGLVGDHLRSAATDPHRILAELGASVYVTTNFDPLLERALKATSAPRSRCAPAGATRRNPAQRRRGRGRRAHQQSAARLPRVRRVRAEHRRRPGADRGRLLRLPDHHDRAAKLMPPEVESALVDNSLLFLGFRLTDWHFRVLFRLMMSLPGRERSSSTATWPCSSTPTCRRWPTSRAPRSTWPSTSARRRTSTSSGAARRSSSPPCATSWPPPATSSADDGAPRGRR
jgi:hypothetical protein